MPEKVHFKDSEETRKHAEAMPGCIPGVMQQISPERIRNKKIKDWTGGMLSLRGVVTHHISRIVHETGAAGAGGIRHIEAANGGSSCRIEDAASDEYNLLQQSLRRLELNLQQTLNLTTCVMFGFQTLAFQDLHNTQVWTELYVASLRRFVLGAAESATFLRARFLNPRVLCIYTGQEVKPEGQCLALKAAISLWLTEDGLRTAHPGDHVLLRDFADPDMEAEDWYLRGMVRQLSELGKELLATCGVLIKVFELTWPGIGRRMQVEGAPI